MSLNTSSATTVKAASAGSASHTSSPFSVSSVKALESRGEVRSFPARSEGAHAARGLNASNNATA